ncbi:MAG: substrate-binding domain-containing protein [Eubacteriales bacterium]|nr:substrate-binding domain-containing protein [Eubacteriales bacterium]
MKKKVLATLLTAAMAATLMAGCGSSTSSTTTESATDAPAAATEAPAEETAEEPAAEEEAETTASAEGGYHFEIVSKGFQHQYWQAVLKGAEQKAEELGDTINFVGPNTESDIADQVQMLQSAINQKPVAIGLAALDTSACLDAITEAQNAGIPIVGFDSGVPGAPEGAVVANCATDNYAAGELAAEETYKLISDRIASADGAVRIGVMGQDATAESIINRGLGFIDKIAELAAADGHVVTIEGNDKYVSDSKVEPTDGANVIIEVLVPAQVTQELSAIDCQNLLSKSDTICIYGSNQHSGDAMVTANQTMNKFGSGDGQVIGVTFDSGTAIKGAVADGTFAGAVTQAPVAMGEALIQTLHDAASGKTVSDVDTGCQWYTAENMDSEEIAQNLYD